MFAILDQTASNTILFISQKGGTKTYTFVGGGYYFKLADYANLRTAIQLSTGQEMYINDSVGDSTATASTLTGFTLNLQ